MNPTRSLLPCLLAATLLVACGKPGSDATSSTPAPSTAAASSSDAPTAPERREAKALADYQLIDLSPGTYPQNVYLGLIDQVRAAFWSGTAKQLDKLAYDYSPDYRHETDTFKRSDMLKTLTPELDRDYVSAQSRHDYAVRTSQLMYIYPYDASLGGFKLAFASADEKQGVGIFKNAGERHLEGSWTFRFIGIPPMSAGKSYVYHPKDQDEARALEAVLASQRNQGNEAVLTYAQYNGDVIGAIWGPMNDDSALLRVDAVTAVDRKSGKPLLTFGGKDLGPIEVQCQSTRDALKLAAPEIHGAVFSEAMSSTPSC
ncbi:hypothetical protein [Dyella sp. 20L07]|uniref:hypothetical protein n=1 Tax=Dyella sp. 20L07 TaxID=3384240 RepID=UPI003D29B33A